MPAAPTIPAPSAKPAAPAAGFCYAYVCLCLPMFAYMRCTHHSGSTARCCRKNKTAPGLLTDAALFCKKKGDFCLCTENERKDR